MKELRGIVPPMVTPLRDRDTLDVAGLERLLEHMLDGGVHGVFVLGTTGEAPSLSYALRRELIARTCRQVRGRVPVLVGITDTAFVESLGLGRWAAEAGADAVVLAPPYYFPVAQPELGDYVEHLAAELPLPLFLYNTPAMAKVAFEPATLERLLQNARIVGVKDSSGDLACFERILSIARARPDWSVLIGPEHLLAAALGRGGHGGVSGGANLRPRLFVDLYAAARAQDAARLAVLQARLLALGQLYEIGQHSSAVIKGLKCALSRSPAFATTSWPNRSVGRTRASASGSARSSPRWGRRRARRRSSRALGRTWTQRSPPQSPTRAEASWFAAWSRDVPRWSKPHPALACPLGGGHSAEHVLTRDDSAGGGDWEHAEPAGPSPGDAMLRAYLGSSEPATAEAALSTLLCAHAAPLIERVVRSKRLRADEDVDDLVQGALLRLVARLRACRAADRDSARIEAFENYVAATAHHVFTENLRSKNPEHRRLRRRLVSALRRDDRFQLVRDGQGRWLCALAVPCGGTSSSGSQPSQVGEVHAALSALARPVKLEAIVAALCESGASAGKAPPVAPPPWPSPESQASDRMFLRRLWAEIEQLPIAQRQAMLLNLSDPQGRDLIALLPLTGTASMRDIARALEMPPDDLAGLWPHLPLDDAAIAGRLALSRQQVVNLRAAARRRLLRRLGAPR